MKKTAETNSKAEPDTADLLKDLRGLIKQTRQRILRIAKPELTQLCWGREVERFLLELGMGFALVARHKGMTIDSENFYLDLLFYQRDLRRLVAVELRIGTLAAADREQMELYLRWLNRYEKRPGEEAPIGLILCSQKSPQQIELLQLNEGDIRVAEFFTERLPVPMLEKQMEKALLRAEEQIARQQGLE